MKREQSASKQAADRAEVLAKIAQMPEPFRAMGERLHELVTQSAPELTPRTWYGMPAYARDGKVVCFFNAEKYMTFGFTEDANLTREQGAAHHLVASAYFVLELDEATEAELGKLVKKAAS